MDYKIRKCLNTITIICLVLILSGCTNRNTGLKETNIKETNESDGEPTGEMIPVGEFSILPLEIQNTAWLYADQADLYYWESQWDEMNKVLENYIYKWNVEDKQKELLLESSNPDDSINTVFNGHEGNIYVYGRITQDSIIHYYLKKIAGDGSLVWHEIMDYDTMGLLEGQNIIGGVADRKGQICLYDRYGKLFLFNEKGQLQKKVDLSSGPVDGMVCVGERGVIGYHFDTKPDLTDNSLAFSSIDLASGSVGSEQTCLFESGFDGEAVWGGTENQIYVVR